ncbi:hypothetical protein EV659_10935 [Rhodothalassium salexigens DSM 2132]|uniref:Uncharacterized protein n=1 Tax=Rhodothalassium salexigens DSM 2132 TaxID=1188247 RepID=A0A4R2PBN5_RHOSA|nr:hypothetical protein [Rhodothalassium salexigens DSM 2132]TCP32543.1 hypothetical protein EV659_10935 [Rhodothalassium salexigens DSM 2132]
MAGRNNRLRHWPGRMRSTSTPRCWRIDRCWLPWAGSRPAHRRQWRRSLTRCQLPPILPHLSQSRLRLCRPPPCRLTKARPIRPPARALASRVRAWRTTPLCRYRPIRKRAIRWCPIRRPQAHSRPPRSRPLRSRAIQRRLTPILQAPSRCPQTHRRPTRPSPPPQPVRPVRPVRPMPPGGPIQVGGRRGKRRPRGRRGSSRRPPHPPSMWCGSAVAAPACWPDGRCQGQR